MSGAVVWKNVGVLNDAAADWNEACCTDDCCWGADWGANWVAEKNAEKNARRDAEKNAETNADDSESSDNAETNVGKNVEKTTDDLKIFNSAVWNAKTSERADEGAETDADDLENFERADGKNFRNFNAAARVFEASRNDLILNEINFFWSSHFSISSLDHAVRFPSFNVSANAFAIEILPSWNIHTPRILRKCRNFRNCILLIRLKSSSV